MDKNTEENFENTTNIEKIEEKSKNNTNIEKVEEKTENNKNADNNELNEINNDNNNNNIINNDINIENNNAEDSIFDDDFSFQSNEDNEDSNSENDMEDPYAGYVPLNGYCLLDDDEDNENGNCTDEELEKEKAKEALKKNKLVIEASKDNEIPEDDLNIISSVMAKISIPESSIPEWAKKIPEDLWIPEVIKKE